MTLPEIAAAVRAERLAHHRGDTWGGWLLTTFCDIALSKLERAYNKRDDEAGLIEDLRDAYVYLLELRARVGGTTIQPAPVAPAPPPDDEATPRNDDERAVLTGPVEWLGTETVIEASLGVRATFAAIWWFDDNDMCRCVWWHDSPSPSSPCSDNDRGVMNIARLRAFRRGLIKPQRVTENKEVHGG